MAVVGFVSESMVAAANPNFYGGPGVGWELMGTLEPGTVFAVTEGPYCNDTYWFIKVHTDYGTDGWIVVGTTDGLWVEEMSTVSNPELPTISPVEIPFTVNLEALEVIGISDPRYSTALDFLRESVPNIVDIVDNFAFAWDILKEDSDGRPVKAKAVCFIVGTTSSLLSDNISGPINVACVWTEALTFTPASALAWTQIAVNPDEYIKPWGGPLRDFLFGDQMTFICFIRSQLTGYEYCDER